jgi:quercetin dioxygenase-like cupin family protein
MDTPDGVSAVFSVRDLREAIATPADGIVSRSIFVDDDVRVVLFSFAPGQRLTDHTAAVPVLIQVVDGEARIGIAGETLAGRPGTWLHLPAHTSHSVEATTPLTLLLVMLSRHGPPEAVEEGRESTSSAHLEHMA